MKEKKPKVSYNDIQTFKNSHKTDKLKAIKKDHNSDYNSFFSSDTNKSDPSSPGTNIKD